MRKYRKKKRERKYWERIKKRENMGKNKEKIWGERWKDGQNQKLLGKKKEIDGKKEKVLEIGRKHGK